MDRGSPPILKMARMGVAIGSVYVLGVGLGMEHGIN